MNTNKIVIVTDSSASIPPKALKGLDVSVIPLWLIWDGEGLQDSVDITSSEFYKRLKSSKTMPTTSQPTPAEFATFFKKQAETADSIVAVLVSSKISGTYESAVIAKDQLSDLDIQVIDSANSSMGMGFGVLAAADAAACGKSVDEVVKNAEDMLAKNHFIFLVDTLEFLHRSGRIRGTKRWLGTLLQVKPMLHFEDGLIQPLTSERTMGKAIKRMLNITEQRLAGRQMHKAAVVDIDCPDRGDQVAEMIQQRFKPSQILLSDVSPVVGNVVGPGAFGVTFYAED